MADPAPSNLQPGTKPKKTGKRKHDHRKKQAADSHEESASASAADSMSEGDEAPMQLEVRPKMPVAKTEPAKAPEPKKVMALARDFVPEVGSPYMCQSAAGGRVVWSMCLD